MGWNGEGAGRGHKESLVRKQMKTFRKNQASRLNMLNINKMSLSEASSPLSRGGFFFDTNICRNLCYYRKLSFDACVEHISEFLEKLELRCSGVFCEASDLPCVAGLKAGLLFLRRVRAVLQEVTGDPANDFYSRKLSFPSILGRGF